MSRAQGIASRLLREYAAHVRRTQLGVRRVLLICRPELIPLYTRAGFVYVDKSAVVHGACLQRGGREGGGGGGGGGGLAGGMVWDPTRPESLGVPCTFLFSHFPFKTRRSVHTMSWLWRFPEFTTPQITFTHVCVPFAGQRPWFEMVMNID